MENLNINPKVDTIITSSQTTKQSKALNRRAGNWGGHNINGSGLTSPTSIEKIEGVKQQQIERVKQQMVAPPATKRSWIQGTVSKTNKSIIIIGNSLLRKTDLIKDGIVTSKKETKTIEERRAFANLSLHNGIIDPIRLQQKEILNSKNETVIEYEIKNNKLKENKLKLEEQEKHINEWINYQKQFPESSKEYIDAELQLKIENEKKDQLLFIINNLEKKINKLEKKIDEWNDLWNSLDHQVDQVLGQTPKVEHQSKTTFPEQLQEVGSKGPPKRSTPLTLEKLNQNQSVPQQEQLVNAMIHTVEQAARKRAALDANLKEVQSFAKIMQRNPHMENADLFLEKLIDFEALIRDEGRYLFDGQTLKEILSKINDAILSVDEKDGVLDIDRDKLDKVYQMGPLSTWLDLGNFGKTNYLHDLLFNKINEVVQRLQAEGMDSKMGCEMLLQILKPSLQNEEKPEDVNSNFRLNKISKEEFADLFAENKTSPETFRMHFPDESQLLDRFLYGNWKESEELTFTSRHFSNKEASYLLAILEAILKKDSSHRPLFESFFSHSQSQAG